MLSNLVSLILFGLGMILFATYYWWFGGSLVTWAIPVLALLCLSTLLFNHLDYSTISRVVSFTIPQASSDLQALPKIIGGMAR